MGKFACEACGKSHNTYAARVKCETKHSTGDCGCPAYWRAMQERGWTSHSYSWGCPLAEKPKKETK